MKVQFFLALVSTILHSGLRVHAKVNSYSEFSIYDLRAHPEAFLGMPLETECKGIGHLTTRIRKGVIAHKKSMSEGTTPKQERSSFIKTVIGAISKENLKHFSSHRPYPEACLNFLKKYYVAVSLNSIFDEDMVGFCKNSSECYLGARKGYPDAANAPNYEFATTDDLIYAAAMSVLRYGNIRFLDLNERDALNKEGHTSVWTQKSKEERYRVLGAYRCSDKTIYVDPSLPSADLAATFIHELEHLYRDAFLRTNFNSDRKLLDEHIRNDELLAAVTGGFAQWQILRFLRPELKNIIKRIGIVYAFLPKQPYTIGKYFPKWDLSFISEEGVLGKLIAFGPEASLPNLIQQTFLAKEIYSKDANQFESIKRAGTWLYGNESKKHTSEIKILDAIGKIEAKIEKAYGLGAVTDFKPLQLSLSYSPFLSSIDTFDSKVMPRKDDYRALALAFPADNPGANSFFYRLVELRVFLEQEVRSPICQQEIDILKASSSRPGKDGVRTEDDNRNGKDGVRTETPARPCLHGSGKL